jgi:hypothetical protein
LGKRNKSSLLSQSPTSNLLHHPTASCSEYRPFKEILILRKGMRRMEKRRRKKRKKKKEEGEEEGKQREREL